MRFVLYFCIIISLIACNNPSSGLFRLEGSVENSENSENMILYYHSLTNGEWYEIADTAKIINGKFVFEGNIDGLTAAVLCFDYTNVVIDVRIYLEPTKMKMQINKNQPYLYELSGTKVEKENIELRNDLESDAKIYYEGLKCLNDLLKQINSNLEGDNTAVLDSLINLVSQTKEQTLNSNFQMNKTRLDFSSRHNTYRIVPDLLYLLTKSEFIPVDTIKRIYNNLPEQSKTGLMGKLALRQIEYLEKEKTSLDPNEKVSLIDFSAPDFTRKDLSGKVVRLSDFKDSFVLLDFWASWCIPCIKDIPKIKELHNKYSEKGLKIIGISLDSDKNRWLNAINKHQLNVWTQILSVEDRNNAVFIDDISSMYNVEAIPYFVLIDKQGKIVVNGWLGEEGLIKTDSILTAGFMP